MDQPSKGYRFSSARRGGRGPSPAVIAAVAIVALVTLLAIFYHEPEPELVRVSPTPTSPPTPTSLPTATATAAVELASGWVVASSPEDTPTPWPTSPPPVRRAPTPTPRVSECVSYRWSTVQVFRPFAQVLTEIKAENNCNRDLNPTELMFEISGWRHGEFIQSIRGMPFDRIRRRHSGIISIGLPGSLDWYDEIVVEILD